MGCVCFPEPSGAAPAENRLLVDWYERSADVNHAAATGTAAAAAFDVDRRAAFVSQWARDEVFCGAKRLDLAIEVIAAKPIQVTSEHAKRLASLLELRADRDNQRDRRPRIFGLLVDQEDAEELVFRSSCLD